MDEDDIYLSPSEMHISTNRRFLSSFKRQKMTGDFRMRSMRFPCGEVYAKQ